MAFRFVLLLGRWCRRHHRPFPVRIGRMLLAHGFVPAAALIAGVSVWGTLSLLGVMGAVFPAFETGLGRSPILFGIWGWLSPPWIRPIFYLVSYAPLLATVVLFWLCRVDRPGLPRRTAIRVVSAALLVLVIPLADLAGVGLCVAVGAALVWALAPRFVGHGVAAARWLGLIEGGER